MNNASQIFVSYHRHCLVLTIILISLCHKLSAQQHDAKDTLPKPAGWVNDFENIYTDKQEKKLMLLITDFEKETSVEMVLLTLDTSMVQFEKFDEYVLMVANRWGVGKAGVNNGVVIGISSGYRYISIQNGFGIEQKLTDVETKRIIDKLFIPKFKRGKYYKGTCAGLEALMKELR